MCVVYEPVAYTLAAVLGVVIIVIIVLMMIAYYRMRAPLEPEPIEPELPPDETLGYPYPGYKPPEPYVYCSEHLLARKYRIYRSRTCCLLHLTWMNSL